MRLRSLAVLGASLSAALCTSLLGASSAVAAPAAAASPARPAAATAASVFPAASDPCKGRSQTYVVTRFYRGPGVYPLRCGTTTWGYNHLVYREHDYNPALIALTLARGSQPVPGVQVIQYKWNSETCPDFEYTYTVVYNEGALNGTGVRPQGIITAYESAQELSDAVPAHAKC